MTSLSDVNIPDCLGPEKVLPLTITPKSEKSPAFLKAWLKANREWVKRKTVEHGAVRFRGFDIPSAADYESVLMGLDDNLNNTYRGTSPRNAQPGTKYVFSASEYPYYVPIPQHIEMSFLPAPPRWLYFCCLEAPTNTKGGETSLCDFRKVYQQLDPEFKKKAYKKKIMYVRNYQRKTKEYGFDMTQRKGWEDLFQGKTQQDLVDDAKEHDLKVTWYDGDRMRITNVQEPFQLHPETGEPLWCCHMQVFHVRMLATDLRRSSIRSGFWSQYFLSWFLLAVAWLLIFFKGTRNIGWHTMFGDGTEVTPAEQDHLQETVWRNLVFDQWQQGDVLVIDNFGVSHGRQPYTGKRKVVVSWSQPFTKRNERIPELEA